MDRMDRDGRPILFFSSIGVGMIKNILFSLDGTLLDSYSFTKECFEKVMHNLSFQLDPEFDFGFYYGLPLSRILSRAGVRDETQLHKAIQLFRQEFELHCEEELTLYPSVTEVLQSLKNQDYLLGVYTNRTRIHLQKIMEYSGIKDYCNVSVSADDVEYPIPSTGPILSLMTQYLLLPSEILVVGNTEYDIRMGANAGCLTCGIKRQKSNNDNLQFCGADAIFNSLEDLLESKFLIEAE